MDPKCLDAMQTLDQHLSDNSNDTVIKYLNDEISRIQQENEEMLMWCEGVIAASYSMEVPPDVLQKATIIMEKMG